MFFDIDILHHFRPQYTKDIVRKLRFPLNMKKVCRDNNATRIFKFGKIKELSFTNMQGNTQ